MKKIFLLFLTILLINLSSAYVYDNFQDGVINWTFWKNYTSHGSPFPSTTEAANQLRLDDATGSMIDGTFKVWAEKLLPQYFVKSINVTTTWNIGCASGSVTMVWYVYNQSVFTKGCPDNTGTTTISLYNNRNGTFRVSNSTAWTTEITPSGLATIFDISSSGGSTGTYTKQLYVNEIIYDTYGVWNNITSPSNNTFVNGLTNFTVNNTGILEKNLSNITYSFYYNNGTLANRTLVNITGKANVSTLAFDPIITDRYIWGVNTCGTNGTASVCYQSENRTLTSGFSVNSISYNSTTVETSTEAFILNISLDPSISLSSARLYYNNTYYVSTKVGSGTNIQFINEIEIPTINAATIKSFFWELNLDGETINSSLNTQTINPLNLGYCNATNTVKVFNFTSYLETNLTRVNPFSFAGTFDYYIGSGDIIKTQSIQNLSTAEQVICVSDISVPITMDGEIDYGFEGENLTLTSRKYFFEGATIVNSTQNISLLLLDSEDATTFILKVQDSSNEPVEDALIYIQRYYPGEGIYRTVQIAKTDENGASVGFYQTETVTYKHIIMKDGVVLLDTGTGGIIVGESVPFTLTFTVGDSLLPPWEFLEENSTLLTALSYNKTNQIVTFSYIDPTGATNYGRLFVYQDDLSNSTTLTICNTTSAGSSATITCNMTGYTGTFVAKGYVTTETNLQKIISFIVETAREVFGKTGAFLGMLIILTAAMAFLWNPSVGIVLVNCAIIFVGLIGLLVFSPVAYFSIIGVSIILLILFKT